MLPLMRRITRDIVFFIKQAGLQRLTWKEVSDDEKESLYGPEPDDAGPSNTF
jgi:hypothetical protein